MQESHRRCVFVCAVCMLIISEHDVLGLNYSTHSHVTLTERTLIGESKHTTTYTTPPATKRPQLTAKGNVTGTAQQMGLSIFAPDASACWSHGRLVAGYALFVCFYLWGDTKMYLQKELWGWRGILQYWDLFIESWMESTVNVPMMLAPRGTLGLFRWQSGIQNHRRTISNMRTED